MNDTSVAARPTGDVLADEAAAVGFAREYVVSAGVPAGHHRTAREHAARWFRLYAGQPELLTTMALEGSLTRVFAGFCEHR
ncbi:hypothetical protein [Burkholderia glumae]|uniref:Uncharacterized protein n=1 Tax=Burkholderia glumae TaxID=337 RepID=A0ABY5BCQ0_BURGL|nr:hypothetical protein [Burkholderia glumae]NVE26221.1 hypothetical protein [Burkholderia glumae]QGA41645.1 hypothetical protein GAS19_29610 [Burkholderia glumae]QHP94777.1 hypothetical protein EXE55_28055 [Burkholderia glumae]QKM51650.1 hypothetical protein B7760_05727 [Burkholderia glumae]USS44419.1 hypothetical protein NFI99_14210 [Burkholderia glumae]